MFKLTLIVSFMILGTMIWAARLSCDSCGSECASACGTRRFRTCCFNYLRKKRVPESVKFLLQNKVDTEVENLQKSRLPSFIVDNILEQMMASHITDEHKPFLIDDNVHNRA